MHMYTFHSNLILEMLRIDFEINDSQLSDRNSDGIASALFFVFQPKGCHVR